VCVVYVCVWGGRTRVPHVLELLLAAVSVCVVCVSVGGVHMRVSVCVPHALEPLL